MGFINILFIAFIKRISFFTMKLISISILLYKFTQNSINIDVIFKKILESNFAHIFLF